ncbi:MAG: hypothetical protein OEY22_11240 [Candidatus Bathyarchaeota archaeon]|nr:hypothetical protein [Candidatus Bathyarchaeota archaeon]MDH5787576.1 hypothetical protein [Candidatus Bathyarchaeota archaeon]
MTLTELIRMLGDITEVAVTIMLAVVVYKIAMLIDSLEIKIREKKS